MSISYLRAENIKVGQSAIAAAAYRSGEKLVDEQDGRIKNYRGKSSEVVFDKVYLPKEAPKEFLQKERLWNSAQWAELNFEKRNLRNGARLAKSLTIAVPNEFSLDQEKNSMNDLANFFTEQGYGVQIDIHHPDVEKKNAKNKSKFKSKENKHIHILVTARKINVTGFDLSAPKQKKDYVYVLDTQGNKVPELDENGNPKLNQRKQPVYKRVPLLDENGNQRFRERKGKGKEPLWATQTIESNWLDDAQTLVSLKDHWANICNRELEKDHKKISFHTYEKIKKENSVKPEYRLEPQIHLGQAAWGMLQKGKSNEKAEKNERIKARNKEKLHILNINQEEWQTKIENNDLEIFKFDVAVALLDEQKSEAEKEVSKNKNLLYGEYEGFAKEITRIKSRNGVYKASAEAEKEKLFKNYQTASEELKKWNEEHKNKFAAFLGINVVIGWEKELSEKEKLETKCQDTLKAYKNYDVVEAEKELWNKDHVQMYYQVIDAKRRNDTKTLEKYFDSEASKIPAMKDDQKYQMYKSWIEEKQSKLDESVRNFRLLTAKHSHLEALEYSYNARKEARQPQEPYKPVETLRTKNRTVDMEENRTRQPKAKQKPNDRDDDYSL